MDPRRARTPAGGRLLLGLIVAIFALRLAAQVAVTPLGEGLDFFSHLAYIVFMAEQGHPPAPHEPSVPDWLVRLAATVPGPDNSPDGRDYRAWAQQDALTQAQTRAILNADTTTAAYPQTNNQSQHPPLYYWLLSGVYRAFPAALGLEARVYLLGLVSVALASLALPGIYKTLRLYVDETPALLALLALAWYPNLWPFLARITNDSLAMPLLVWGFYFCLRARASQDWRHLALAGGLLVLACFTKTYALTLAPVYLLCAVAGPGGKRATWRNLLVAGPVAALGLGALFGFNWLTTGHLIPLTEMRITATLPWVTRLGALFQVDPLWFVGGLAKGFWWLGYWSFVSPGAVLFLAPVAALGVLILRPRERGPWHAHFGLRALWPHYAAGLLFGTGMLWHAALFALEARQAGAARYSGNEGWYANVLLGSVWAIGLVLLQARLSPAALRRVLSGALAVLMLTSLVSQAAVALYWGGAVEVRGLLRSVPWDQFFAGLFSQAAWANWLSLPGIIQPVALTAALPLLLALAGAVIVWRMLAARA